MNITSPLLCRKNGNEWIGGAADVMVSELIDGDNCGQQQGQCKNMIVF